MAEQKAPFVMYGPNGEARTFTDEKDVPKGFYDHPAKALANSPAQKLENVKTLTQTADLVSAEAKIAARQAEQEYQALTGSAPMTAALRARLENRQQESAPPPAATGSGKMPAGNVSQDELDDVKGKQPKSGARKLEVPKPDAKKDGDKKAAQTGREETLATIREAGIEIADDATDAEISAALAELPE